MMRLWIASLSIAIAFLVQQSNAQWVQVGPEYGGFVSGFASKGGIVFVSIYGDGVYRSTDDGENWTSVDSGLTDNRVYSIAAIGTDLYAGAVGLFLSTNDGSSWIAQLNTDFDIFAIVPRGSDIFLGSSQGLTVSSDTGKTWTQFPSPLPHVESILFKDSSFFIGRYGGSLFRSTDNGANWAKLDSGLGPELNVQNLASIGSSLFAGGKTVLQDTWDHAGLFVSKDNGDSWNPVIFEFNYPQVSDLLVDAEDFFAAIDGRGVFLSQDSGLTWRNVSDGLTTSDVSELGTSGPYLFAGTYAGRVYRRLLSQMTAAESSTLDMPSQFTLSQNFPNPFNPTTSISLGVPVRSSVQLTMFDELGRAVANLVSKELPRGFYTYRWDASGFPSGIYFCRMRAGSYNRTLKLLLIR